MSSDTSKIMLDSDCQKQPNYYIDEDSNSAGSSCYSMYKLTGTNAQNQAVENYCSKFKTFLPNNVNFNNCMLNWKPGKAKNNWLSSICSESAI